MKQAYIGLPALSLVSEDPPVSEVEDALQYVMPPIRASEVWRLDAVLYSHADADHLGELTAKELIKKGIIFHGTQNVKQRLIELGAVEEQVVVHAPREIYHRLRDCGDDTCRLSVAGRISLTKAARVSAEGLLRL